MEIACVIAIPQSSNKGLGRGGAHFVQSLISKNATHVRLRLIVFSDIETDDQYSFKILKQKFMYNCVNTMSV